MAEACCLHPGGVDFTAKLIEKAQLTRGSHILDAGCGAGTTVMWLRAQGYEGYGIDKKPGCSAPWVRQGSLQSLPYDDACFAAVISECTAFICGDTRAMLEESFRVLHEDGELLLGDVYFKEEHPLPQFDDNRPVTLHDWQQILEACGFKIIEIEDVSAAWKPFVIEQLWAGRTLEDLWGGCLAQVPRTPGQYKPGYFLLRAQKGVSGDE